MAKKRPKRKPPSKGNLNLPESETERMEFDDEIPGKGPREEEEEVQEVDEDPRTYETEELDEEGYTDTGMDKLSEEDKPPKKENPGGRKLG